jgi:hypothetical protein
MGWVVRVTPRPPLLLGKNRYPLSVLLDNLEIGKVEKEISGLTGKIVFKCLV